MVNAKSRNAPGGKPKTKRPRIASGVRVEIERMLRAGASNNEIGTRYGVAEGSVRYIKGRMKEADAASTESAPAVDGVPERTLADAGIADDTTPEAGLAQVNAMIRDLQQQAALAREDRNFSAAARAAAEAAGLMPLKERLRKAVEQGSGDVVTIPRDQVDARLERIYSRMRTLASVEMCPHCGRELRMAAVGAAKDVKSD